MEIIVCHINLFQIQLHKTGGGSFEKPTVDETGLKLIATLQTQFLPLANPFDDDVDFHPEVILGKLYILCKLRIKFEV